jgi:hypothetical protein
MPMTTINFTLSQLHVLRERSLRNQLLMHLCVRRRQSTALRHTVAIRRSRDYGRR